MATTSTTGTVTSVGLSGLPISTLLENLETAEKTKLTPLATQQAANTAKITAYGTVKSTVTALQTAATALTKAATFSPLKATVTGSGLSAASDTTAIAGSYSVNVTKLATAQSSATTAVADKAAAISGSGTMTITNGAGKSFDITIADGSSLADIRNTINAAKTGVSASIVSTGDSTNPYKMVLTADSTGTDASFTTSFSGSGDAATLLGGTMTTLQTASNAALTVNGMDITSQTNTVKDAIQGVTMTVSQVGTSSVAVTKDTDTVKASINAFVTAYNAMVTSNKSLTAYNADSTLSGKLLGDGTLRNIQNDIRSAINTTQPGLYTNMAQFGISLDSDGKMTVDDTKLTKALTDNPQDVTEFFTGSTTTGATGFAKNLTTKLTAILQSDGKLATATDGLTASNKILEDRYAALEDTIAATMARYKTQFTALETNVTSMNSTMTYLTQQFELMAKNTSSS
ncbi:flagellar filament capping protein FliD [Pseudomonas putida]|uniref:Flagellar hook-associated protein 2 n=1 Tax=Pseudomonas putida TaxID=303 RepID=A0A8I1E9Z1_PSEPU|nr:flagellar filament capping protein FliD [Pseudomonas putida]MBI6882539.1 flagellar filament capping protein FliD [Pseudomonas putida]